MLKPLAGFALGLALAYCSAAHAADDQTVAKCIYNASPPTAADGAAVALQCDTNGVLQTSGSGGGGSGGTVDQGTAAAAGSAWPVQLVIGGAVNAVGNAIFVKPGTGASWAVSGTFWQATQPVSLATAPVLVAGSAIIGKVGIDQTTPGTTNGIAIAPSSAAGVGIAPTASTAAESNHVLKSGAGNLYAMTTTIGATSGWLMLFDATSAPVDGAVTPKFCKPILSNGTTGGDAESWAPGPPLNFATGITAVFSSTGCFTKTASATAAFFGQVQ